MRRSDNAGAAQGGLGLGARLMHRGLMRATRRLGGAFGQVADLPRRWPEESEIDVGPVRLRTLRWSGTGPPLVLLHGLGNSAWCWARVAMLINATGREVLAISQRGHGGSTGPERGFALADTTRDLGAVLDRLAPGPVVLAGHSWGGKVVQHFAGEAGDRVRGLVLADPVLPQGLNPLLASPRMSRLVELAFRPERRVFASREARDAGRSAVVYLAAGDELDRRVWEANTRARPDGTYGPTLPDGAFWEIFYGALAEDITDRLPRIRCPALLLQPTFSVAFWPGELRPLRRGLRDLREVRVAGEHTFIHTNPRDTAQAILGFLD